MTNTAHTPGPWVIGEINHKKQHVNIDAPFGDPTLGCVAWSSLARVYGCNDNKNAGSNVMEANARLTAAAPELLEALELILTADQRGFDLAYIKGCARAAIAKATNPQTGNQP